MRKLLIVVIKVYGKYIWNTVGTSICTVPVEPNLFPPDLSFSFSPHNTVHLAKFSWVYFPSFKSFLIPWSFHKIFGRHASDQNDVHVAADWPVL